MNVKERRPARLAPRRKPRQNAFLPCRLATVAGTKQGCYDWKRHNYRNTR
jgi:hypothetical protein